MRKGFTLLELIMVVIILGILVSIALPRFTRTSAVARGSEAINQLGAVRGAMERFLTLNGTYVGATYTAAATTLDVDYPADNTSNFDYALSNLAQATFTAIATYDGDAYGATPPAGVSGTVVIDQTGNVTGTGSFSSF